MMSPVNKVVREALEHIIREANKHDASLNEREIVPTGDDYNFLISLIESVAFTVCFEE